MYGTIGHTIPYSVPYSLMVFRTEYLLAIGGLQLKVLDTMCHLSLRLAVSFSLFKVQLCGVMRGATGC